MASISCLDGFLLGAIEGDMGMPVAESMSSTLWRRCWLFPGSHVPVRILPGYRSSVRVNVYDGAMVYDGGGVTNIPLFGPSTAADMLLSVGACYDRFWDGCGIIDTSCVNE